MLIGCADRCPVCNSGLEKLGDTKMQEDHIKECLDKTTKYLVYDLPTKEGLIGSECMSPKLQSSYALIENRYPLFRGNCQRISGGAIELPMQFSQLFVFSSCFISFGD